MTEDVAGRSIDWLHSIGNRVLALMRGEPLLRPRSIHKIIHYDAKRVIYWILKHAPHGFRGSTGAFD